MITHPEAKTAVSYKYLRITSEVFDHNGNIPRKYSCDGENISPPIYIENIPEEAKCLAVVADDPDAPVRTWVHWLVWNIPVTHHIKENEVHGIMGLNDFQECKYGGPCPPSGIHHYYFKVYALDAPLDLPAGADKRQLEKAMAGHILGFGELVGTYGRKNKK